MKYDTKMYWKTEQISNVIERPKSSHTKRLCHVALGMKKLKTKLKNSDNTDTKSKCIA